MPSHKLPCPDCGKSFALKTLNKWGGVDYRCFKKRHAVDKPIRKRPTKKTTRRGKNIGEKDEIRCIKKMLNIQQSKKFATLVSLFKTDDAKDGITLLSPHNKRPIKDVSDIKKARSHDKADIIVEFVSNKRRIYLSIKSKAGAPPATFNHTNRSAYVFQNGYLKDDLHHLDHLVRRMNNQKCGFGEFKIGTGEDQNIEDIQFVTTSVKKALLKLLVYSAFMGTGSKESKTPADCILMVSGDNTNNWIFVPGFTNQQKMQYAESIYPKIVLSVRSKKGMPKKPEKPAKETRSYTKRLKAYNEKMNLCQKWIYRHPNGGLKGALHIRIRI